MARRGSTGGPRFQLDRGALVGVRGGMDPLWVEIAPDAGYYDRVRDALYERDLMRPMDEYFEQEEYFERKLSRHLQVEDRRRYSPSFYYPSMFSGVPATVVADNANRQIGRIRFAAANATVMCARRKVRREVLMAYSRGHGVRSHKRRRRDYWSDVRC